MQIAIFKEGGEDLDRFQSHGVPIGSDTFRYTPPYPKGGVPAQHVLI